MSEKGRHRLKASFTEPSEDASGSRSGERKSLEKTGIGRMNRLKKDGGPRIRLAGYGLRTLRVMRAGAVVCRGRGEIFCEGGRTAPESEWNRGFAVSEF